MQTLDHINGILSMTRDSPQFSNSSNVTVTISEGYFYNNGYFQNTTVDNPGISPFYFFISGNSVTNCEIILKKAIFKSNRNAGAMTVSVGTSELINIQLTELSVSYGVGFGGYGGGLNMFFFLVMWLY